MRFSLCSPFWPNVTISARPLDRQADRIGVGAFCHAVVLGQVGLTFGNTVLNRRSALERIDDPGELDQRATRPRSPRQG
jgi:hypothetical protein